MLCSMCQKSGPAVCSWACVQAATKELDANVEKLRSLPLDDDDGNRRYQLAARNGELTSALMAWKPTLTA